MVDLFFYVDLVLNFFTAYEVRSGRVALHSLLVAACKDRQPQCSMVGITATSSAQPLVAHAADAQYKQLLADAQDMHSAPSSAHCSMLPSTSIKQGWMTLWFWGCAGK
jgi:hypothetical protein